MQNYVYSMLLEQFLFNYNRKPFGKDIDIIIENWCNRIQELANRYKIEAHFLASKALQTIIEVHQKTKNFVPSVNVLLGRKYLEMVEKQISNRKLGITPTEQLIKKYNIKPLTYPRENRISLISPSKFLLPSTSIRTSFAHEETFLGSKITYLMGISPKPIKGNKDWETISILLHFYKTEKDFPITKRILETIEKILFSMLIHNHKEELKKIYYENYEYSGEYCKKEVLEQVLQLWLICRKKVNEINYDIYPKKQQIIDDILQFLGLDGILLNLRKFGTALTVRYSFSYCILLMKAFTLALNQILYKGTTILRPFFQELAYIYNMTTLGDILSFHRLVYDKIRGLKPWTYLKKLPVRIQQKILFLLEETTSRYKIQSLAKASRKKIKDQTIPQIEIRGLEGVPENRIYKAMKKYHIPHLNPKLI